jgi:hypothetical protein
LGEYNPPEPLGSKTGSQVTLHFLQLLFAFIPCPDL